MRLRRLYTNLPDIFLPIEFHDGLNVVLGEIRHPEKRDRDDHNLGKTLLAQIIDFCLIKKKRNDFFLFKRPELFSNFIFFLEIETDDGRHITVRRPVDPGTKLSLLEQDLSADHSDLPEEEWQHSSVPFEKSKKLLDGMLDLEAVSPWTYRHVIAYSLRTQRDYIEPFHLAKHAGKHAEWKPLLAHVLGLDSDLFVQNYRISLDIEKDVVEENKKKVELKGVDGLDKLRGLINIHENDISRYKKEIDIYDFHLADKEINRELVDKLDDKIADLNNQRYYNDTAIKRIKNALREKVDFDLSKVKKVFEQSQVYFSEQLVKDYDDLVAFNKEITKERNNYLQEELNELEQKQQEFSMEIEACNKRRSAALITLRDHEIFSKYKRLTIRLAEKMASIETLKRQESAMLELEELRQRLNEARKKRDSVRDQIKAHLKSSPPRYEKIRRVFDEIVCSVIGSHANLYTTANKEGNPEFKVDILDRHGRSTDEGEGHTYGRLLCIAFDMAVHASYADKSYPHFFYHDGFLETLDDRKKLNLIDAIRANAQNTGLQHILTAIDSELPIDAVGKRFEFEEDEICLKLHDDGKEGRLFRMDPW